MGIIGKPEAMILTLIAFGFILMPIIGPGDGTGRIGNWLYHWQTLSTGVFAIAAAGIGYAAINGAENNRVLRSYRARLGTLPLVLSSASQYADDVIRGLAQARNILAEQRDGGLTANWSPPVFPNDLPPELREFVEVCDYEPANNLVLELLRQLQTLQARLESLVTEESTYRIGVARNIAEYQVQAAKIRQICGALFPFARKDAAHVPRELDRQSPLGTVYFIDPNAEVDRDFANVAEIFGGVDQPWWPRRDV